MKRLLGIISASFLYLFTSVVSFAQTTTPTPISLRVEDPSGVGSIPTQSVFQFIVNFLFAIGFIIALIFLIWGGIKWIFTRGDKTKVEEARNHIQAAIVGLIFVIAAFVIINIVVQLLTGQKFGSFLKLPTLKDTTVPTSTP
jgi:cbb3-type cytochrome oxidase subunit 3